MAGLIKIATFPILLLWSVAYGVPGGIFFKGWAVYENWLHQNRSQIIQWKRYPLRSYRKFTSAVLTHRMRSRPVELAGFTESQVQAEFKREPFPFLILFSNTLVALVILPFAALSGIVLGPIHVFRNGRQNWYRNLQPSAGRSPAKR